MTRLEALQALAEKVEAGDTGRQIPRSLIWAAFGMGLEISGATIGRIFDLILDPEDMMALGAAMALHEAALPGWTVRASAYTPNGNSPPYVHVFKMRMTEDDPIFSANSSGYRGDCLASAWFLAILRALIAIEQAKGDE